MADETGSQSQQAASTPLMFTGTQTLPTQQRVFWSQAAHNIKDKVQSCAAMWIGGLDIDIRTLSILTDDDCDMMRPIKQDWIANVQKSFSTTAAFKLQLDQPLVAMLANEYQDSLQTIEEVFDKLNGPDDADCLKLIVGRHITLAAKEFFDEPVILPVGICRPMSTVQVQTVVLDREPTETKTQPFDNNTRVMALRALYDEAIENKKKARRDQNLTEFVVHPCQGYDETIEVDGVTYLAPLSKEEITAINVQYTAIMQDQKWVKEWKGVDFANDDKHYAKSARAASVAWSTVKGFLNKVPLMQIRQGVRDDDTDPIFRAGIFPAVSGWICRQINPRENELWVDKLASLQLADEKSKWSLIIKPPNEEKLVELGYNQQYKHVKMVAAGRADPSKRLTGEPGAQQQPAAVIANVPPGGQVAGAGASASVAVVPQPPGGGPPGKRPLDNASGGGARKARGNAAKFVNLEMKHKVVVRREEINSKAMVFMATMEADDVIDEANRMIGWRVNLHVRQVDGHTVRVYLGITSANKWSGMAEVTVYVQTGNDGPHVRFATDVTARPLLVPLSELFFVVLNAESPCVPAGLHHGLEASELLHADAVAAWLQQNGDGEVSAPFPSGLDEVQDPAIDKHVRKMIAQAI